MAKIRIHRDSDTSATSVSNIFIDEYMSDANGEFVKIYLYLLRLMNAPDSAFSLSSIADKFEHTEKDVRRALSYWERMKLLQLEYDAEDNLTGICLLDSVPRHEEGALSQDSEASRLPAEDSPAQAKAPEDADSVPPKKCYTADDLKDFCENDQIAELLFIAERYLGRPLSQTDTNTFLYLYDGLGFSADLIEYLVEYCVSKNHTAIRYIETTAIRWAESGIRSVSAAKQEAKIHSAAYYAVMRAFGISGRNLVPSETEFIERWRSEYGFSTELISEACQQTIQSIHQPSFQYADSILKNWKKRQVRSLEDVRRLGSEHRESRNASGASQTGNASKNKFNNFNQRSYDYDQLEKMLLTTNAQR